MAEPALRAEGLSKRFGGVLAVADVSLDLHRDEIHAVIGPNGAGKSTLINLLSGDMRASGGAVRLAGRPIDRLGADRRGLAGIGRSYQKTTIFPAFTVYENVRLSAQAHARRPLRMFGGTLGDRTVVDRTETAVARAGLADHRDLAAGLLSHGGQRQLEIAMVLATDPTVVLLDEPLAGMGPAEAQEMIALIDSLKQGRAVLIVEHDMDAVFALADRLTVMANGAVIATGDPATVRRDPAVLTAYLGEDEAP